MGHIKRCPQMLALHQNMEVLRHKNPKDSTKLRQKHSHFTGNSFSFFHLREASSDSN